MKKLILLLLLIAIPLGAQSNLSKMEKKRFVAGSAVDLDGSTEYMSKTSPTNLDLNGTERITLAANRTFEDSLGMWIAVGSATVSQSNTQKHAGTYSQKVITNGDYSGTQLPFANFTALTADANGIYEKYTKEFWVYLESADTVQAVIGDKSIKRAIAATTWTKFVFNFQITASTINQNIQILFKTTGKTNYVDDVSLSKAWDTMLMCIIKTSASVERRIISLTNQYTLYIRSDGYCAGYFGDVTGQGDVAPISTTISNDGNWNLGAFVINRTGNVTIYTNGGGSASASTANVGRPVDVSTLTLAKMNTTYFSGLLGEAQIVRFTDISQSNVSATTLTQAYKFGIPSSWIGGGSQVVAWYDFRGVSDSQMLRDKSSSGNHLSGTNVSIADKVFGAYPSK